MTHLFEVSQVKEARLRARISSRLYGSQAYTTITGWAIIDTGCSRTSIYDGVARSCGLRVGMDERTYMADGRAYTGPTYSGSLEIVGVPASRRLMVFGSLPRRLFDPSGPIMCLIGVDYLQYCHFSYDGADGVFSLDIQP